MKEWSFVVQVLSRYRWMIGLLAFSAMLHTVLFTYLLPEKYEATALVLIKSEDRIALNPTVLGTKKEVHDVPGNVTVTAETPVKTYMEVIKSRAVAERVVRLLDLDKRTRTPAKNPYHDQLLVWKDHAMDVLAQTWDVMRYGRVLDSNPYETAVQKLTKNMSLHAVKNTYLFEIRYLSSDPEEAAAVANAAASVFMEYNSGAHQSEAHHDRAFLSTRLQESEQELLASREALREFKERHNTIAFEEETTDRLKIIGELEASLEKTDAELAGLAKQYQPSHPKVQQVAAESTALQASISKRKAQLDRLPQEEAELARLKLNVRAAEGKYELLTREYEEVKIREAKNTKEIRLVSPATVPSAPKKPIKVYYVSVSLALALLIGVALALMLEATRDTLDTVMRVEQELGLRVMATIPTMKLGRQ